MPIESKYAAGAAVIGFLAALVLSHGSLAAALGALGLIAGLGWVAHRIFQRRAAGGQDE